MDIENIKNKVIISVQAAYDEPLYDETAMSAMMQSVINGGAQGLRVAGERDTAIAKRICDLPVIGITKPKVLPENWLETVYITPTVDDAQKIINAGADIIAFDGTSRARQNSIQDMVEFIHKSNRLAMADIATFEEGINCSKLGCDIVSTTLSGYTKESLKQSEEPDFELLEKLVKSTGMPVILEGRIWEPQQVKHAFELGAWAVVIGSAITRPQLITKRFVNY